MNVISSLTPRSIPNCALWVPNYPGQVTLVGGGVQASPPNDLRPISTPWTAPAPSARPGLLATTSGLPLLVSTTGTQCLANADNTSLQGTEPFTVGFFWQLDQIPALGTHVVVADVLTGFTGPTPLLAELLLLNATPGYQNISFIARLPLTGALTNMVGVNVPLDTNPHVLVFEFIGGDPTNPVNYDVQVDGVEIGNPVASGANSLVALFTNSVLARSNATTGMVGKATVPVVYPRSLTAGERFQLATMLFQSVAPQIFVGAKVSGFDATHFASSPPAGWTGLSPGQSVVLEMTIDGPGPAGVRQGILGCGTAPGGNLDDPASKGTFFFYDATANTVEAAFCQGGAHVLAGFGNAVAGRNRLAVANVAGVLHYSLSGAAVLMTGAFAFTPPDGASIFEMGNWAAPGSAFTGGVPCFQFFNRILSDAELVAKAGAVFPPQPGNRDFLPPDATATVDWNALRDWDGVSATSTSQGTAPITFTMTAGGGGVPTRPITSEKVVLTQNPPTPPWVDTELPITPPLARQSAPYGSPLPLAQFFFHSGAGHPQVGVGWVGTDMSANAPFNMAGVYKDGAFLAQVPASPGTESDGVLRMEWKELDAIGAVQTDHAVKVVGGAQLFIPTVGLFGGMVSCVQMDASVDTTPPAPPAKRITVYGDSIAIGYKEIPPEQGWTSLYRNAREPTWRLTCESYGGLSLFDSSTVLFAAAQKFVEECQDVALGGTKVLWIAIGYNDYARSQWGPGAFGTAYGSLVDLVHAIDPTITIYAQRMIPSANDAVANLLGFTLLQYDAQVAALTVGRPWLNYVDTSGWVIPTSDGIHPTVAGYVTYAANVEAAVPP